MLVNIPTRVMYSGLGFTAIEDNVVCQRKSGSIGSHLQ